MCLCILNFLNISLTNKNQNVNGYISHNHPYKSSSNICHATITFVGMFDKCSHSLSDSFFALCQPVMSFLLMWTVLASYLHQSNYPYIFSISGNVLFFFQLNYSSKTGDDSLVIAHQAKKQACLLHWCRNWKFFNSIEMACCRLQFIWHSHMAQVLHLFSQQLILGWL